MSETGSISAVRPYQRSRSKSAAQPGRPSSKARHSNPRTLHNRMRDRWDLMAKVGLDPMWGTAIGLLFSEGVITETEASAARLYAEAAGRYDRYCATARRTAHSPAYERGVGRDDEVARNEQNNTVASYERRARRAKRVWARIQKHIPNDRARDAIEALCLHNREPHSSGHADLKVILKRIAKEFFGAKTDV
jgi:hypothetical protein